MAEWTPSGDGAITEKKKKKPAYDAFDIKI